MTIWIENGLQDVAEFSRYLCRLPGIFLQSIDNLIVGSILNEVKVTLW